METCFKILQLKFDQKLTNRCIGLTLLTKPVDTRPTLEDFKKPVGDYLAWEVSKIIQGGRKSEKKP
ncbi:TPA: hypothetical protein ACXKGF_004920 [Escherichia coli]